MAMIIYRDYIFQCNDEAVENSMFMTVY